CSPVTIGFRSRSTSTYRRSSVAADLGGRALRRRAIAMTRVRRALGACRRNRRRERAAERRVVEVRLDQSVAARLVAVGVLEVLSQEVWPPGQPVADRGLPARDLP